MKSDEDHKADKNEKTYCIDSIKYFRRNAGTFKIFNENEKDAAAVERREWDKIDDSQVERDGNSEGKYINESKPCSIADNTDDTNRPGNLREVRMADE